MKKMLYLVTTVLVIFLTMGCQPSLEKDNLEIKLAPIEEMSAMMLMSDPPQIEVYIKGGLADSCTTFHELKTERSVNIFKITVTVQRPRDAVCAEVYSYFEKCENLGSDFISGETYTIHVNDKTTTFIMP
jgi:hypothetical protein